MNNENLKRLYAYNWETLPNYVFCDADGKWRNFESEIGVAYNQLNGQTVNPIEYYNQVNDKAKVPLNLTKEEICFYFVFANRVFHKFMYDVGRNMFAYKTSFNIDDETEEIIQKLYNDISVPEIYNNYLNEKILEPKKKFKMEFEKEERDKVFLNKLPTVSFSKFEVEKLVRNYKIIGDKIIGNIDTLFDKIVVDENLPFISTQQFYKVLKGYSYDTDMIPEESNVLNLYANKVLIELRYTNTDEFVFSFEIKQNERDNQVITDICRILKITKDDIELLKEKFNGISWYPRQTLNTCIWKDLVFNNEIISKKLVIDEHAITNKKKKQLKRQVQRKVFFMYYIHDQESKTTLTMREDETDGVRVRIMNANSVENANDILTDISLFLSLYNYLGHKIAKDYNFLLKDNIIEYKPPMEEKVGFIKEDAALKDIAPKMFLSNYTRKCLHLPRIVNKDDAKDLEDKGNFVLKFPKEEEKVEKFYFACDKHPTHPFPGLRENSLENKNTYPFLPCCYNQDHRQKKNSFLKKYYDSDKTFKDFVSEQELTQEEQVIQYRFLISDKFVSYEQSGKCSDEIVNFFHLYTLNNPLRKGVHRSKYSFLECVLLSTNYENFKDKTSSQRQEVVLSEFKRLQGIMKTTGICYQECWNMTSKIIKDDEYLDPRRYLRLLEYLYKCRLVLMNRTDFFHPEHNQGYLRWQYDRNRKIVILYEHYGSEANQATYPQCELIQVEDMSENTYEKIYIDYINSLQIATTDCVISTSVIDALLEKYELKSQYLDFYGKIYALLVEDKKERTLHTLFLKNIRFPPMFLPVESDIYYSKEDKDFVISRYLFSFRKEPVDSLLNNFDELRTKVRYMIEYAKKIYSEHLNRDDYKEGDWDWIKINKDVPDYSTTIYSNRKDIIVPNEESKKRLIYTLKLYQKRFNTKLMLYKDKNYIETNYNTICDFEYQENSIISESNNQIKWDSDFYTILPIDGTLYNSPFVTFIQDEIYKCIPIDKLSSEWSSYKVFFPQIKKIYKVNVNELGLIKNINNIPTLLIIQNKINLQKMYICEKLSTIKDI